MLTDSVCLLNDSQRVVKERIWFGLRYYVERARLDKLISELYEKETGAGKPWRVLYSKLGGPQDRPII